MGILLASEINLAVHAKVTTVWKSKGFFLKIMDGSKDYLSKDHVKQGLFL